jgi:hypothetical protein
LQDIEQLERKILKHLFRTSGFTAVLKAPARPHEQPHIPIPEETSKGKVHDDNIWVWDLYQECKEMLGRAVSPLDEYIKTFDKFNK